MELAHQKLQQLVKSWIGASEKLPRLSPIRNQLETCSTRSTSVSEEPFYTAPMIGFVVSQKNGWFVGFTKCESRWCYLLIKWQTSKRSKATLLQYLTENGINMHIDKA